MALTYTEFDTTVQTLVHDLRQAILGSTDWSRIGGPTGVIQSTSASAAVAATALTFTTTAGFSVGQVIRIGASGGAATEYKTITALTATTVTFTGQGLVYAQASGTQVFSGSEILKATTTRGADMIIDLTDSAPVLNGLVMAAWKSHDGTTGTDKSSRWLYWRSVVTAATPAMPLHVVVSASKEHLFFSIEGPRANEAQATSAVAGSAKNYFFFSDVVPYHAGDTTPIVFCGGGMAATIPATPASNSHQGNFSRNYQNNGSWSVAKLASLDFPSLTSTETIQMTRQTTADGKFYLGPYVCFGDESGIRGRLASFFHAGYNFSDTPEIMTPPIGTKVTYGGNTYKLLAVNKGDGTNNYWGQFGSAGNSAVASAYKSVVVAVPCTP